MSWEIENEETGEVREYEIEYDISGRHHKATFDAPAEYPEVDIHTIYGPIEKGKTPAEIPHKEWEKQGFTKYELEKIETQVLDAPPDEPEYEPDEALRSVLNGLKKVLAEERYTAMIKWPNGDTEEIDVDAAGKDQAKAEAEKILAKDYASGGRVAKVIGPRSGMYIEGSEDDPGIGRGARACYKCGTKLRKVYKRTVAQDPMYHCPKCKQTYAAGETDKHTARTEEQDKHCKELVGIAKEHAIEMPSCEVTKAAPGAYKYEIEGVIYGGLPSTNLISTIEKYFAKNGGSAVVDYDERDSWDDEEKPSVLVSVDVQWPAPVEEAGGKVVGWSTKEGEQYCKKCMPNKPREGYPIRKGDPDWGYGSVPICKKCRQELDTIPDNKEERMDAPDKKVMQEWRRMATGPIKNLVETSETGGMDIVPPGFTFPDPLAFYGYTVQKLPITIRRSIDRMTPEGQNAMGAVLAELIRLRPMTDQLVSVFATMTDCIDKYDGGSIEGREVARVFRYLMDAARFTQGGAEIAETL